MTVALALPYPEHLGPALGAHALSSGPLILHYDRFRILDFHLLAALHAVGLHWFTS
jgi:hypothetical protein